MSSYVPERLVVSRWIQLVLLGLVNSVLTLAIFRNVQYQSPRIEQCGSQSCITSASNQAFDSTLRNLIDDSVQEENTSAAAATLAFPHHNDANPGLDASSVGKGSTHSLSGLDSPMPPPPVTHCCIQGCVRKKTILKDGRRPAVSSWQRFWIQVSGPHLVFYSPKSLRGSDRSDIRREPQGSRNRQYSRVDHQPT